MIRDGDVQWSLNMFRMLSVGGTWAVPRSGLVFQKKSSQPPVLALLSVMPHETAMPMSAEKLNKFQREDFEVIKEKFTEAGIAVEGSV